MHYASQEARTPKSLYGSSASLQPHHLSSLTSRAQRMSAVLEDVARLFTVVPPARFKPPGVSALPLAVLHLCMMSRSLQSTDAMLSMPLPDLVYKENRSKGQFMP